MNILAVDDDPIFLTVLEATLASLRPCTVTATEVPEEALARVAADAFDLVITDLNMPGTDGLAFLRRLSEAGYRGSVLVISGERDVILNSAEHFAAGLGLSIVGRLRKPLAADRLAALLERAETREPKVPPPLAATVVPGSVTPVLHYQPQVDLVTGRVVGAEGLVRGVTPDGSVIGAAAVLGRHATPDERLALSLQLLEAFCRDMAEIHVTAPSLRLSFNVDACVLEREAFVAALLGHAGRGALDPALTTVELTERQLPSDGLSLLETIARLGMAGFDVAMDDFGTGASNYEFLRKGAFGEIKLDHTITQATDTDPIARRFVRYAVSLAQDCGARLVAEGVEHEETARFLVDQDVSTAQGYYYGRPAPLAELARHIGGRDGGRDEAARVS